MTRGEIWWYEPADRKARPVCILTRPEGIPVLNRVLVIAATRRQRGLPHEVVLTPADGMSSECVLNFDDVQTVPKSLLTRRITRLREPKLAELCEALRTATGC